MLIGASACGNICRTVKQVLRSHYAKLAASTETCLQKIADEMYSKDLINREVKNLPNFAKIEIDFSALLSLHTEDTKKTEELCWLFLDCLATVEGPAKEEAIALAKDWECEVFKSHQISLSLTKKTPEVNPKEVQLSSKDKLAKDLQNLQKRYPILIADITTYYANSEKHDTLRIARWVQFAFDDTSLVHDGVTIDEIFKKMKPHYNFLEIESINDLMEAYPIDDTELQSRFDQYAEDLDSFIDSAELDDVMTAINTAINDESTKVDPKVILKLSGKWSDKTIGNLRKLTEYLFGKELAMHLTITKFMSGSIQIQFLVSSYIIVPALIDRAEACVQFMHYFGIFQLTINDQMIIDRDEDVNFSFEESLLHLIRHIESHSEYERIALLLIEFEVQLNYQNNEGETALILASEGGHIDVFKFLLLHGANPFVQLPENKGCIGLNSLACTALSRHIHSSIGGEKIVAQPGTCVGDMLERAVRERGVSDSVYKLFVSIIENKLIERFQSLHCCFQALENEFCVSSNRALVNKTLVTKARHIFHSYIEEEVKCNNVHQLQQLLQPHYSCLNINLLNITCMILEPIKEMVDSYNTELKTFKDTTTLSELVIMTSTKEMEAIYTVRDKCSKLILKLNKSWGSRKITELNKMETHFLLPVFSFLNLIEMHQDGSSFTCTYLLPASQFQPVLDIVIEKSILLHKIGVYEIFVNSIPVLMEDEDESFKFEDALQKAYQDNDEEVLFFLIELNISLPSASDIVPSINNIESSETVQTLQNKHNDGQTALMFACHNGHHQVVELLLSKNPDINIQNNDGWTASMLASRNGHHQVVELLLSKDPDINIQNNNGWTALMLASRNGHHQVVELLLCKDSDINIQSNDGWTALMLASSNGHHQVVELLLSKDPDINIRNNNGWTALMLASRNGHHQVVELLLSKDPDINIQNNNGWTALMLASRNGHHQVVELLLSKDPDINIQKINGWTALMLASRNGHHQVVELLLSNDPDINIQNNNGWTALMFASGNGHHQIVELLLSKDPDINIQDNDGWTALMSACHNGHHQVVELLLSNDPDINIQNNNGVTALMFASGRGHLQIVELLLSKDPDINIQDNDGWTALMSACRNRHHQVVELLLSNDPDINIQNNDGWTALMLASTNGHHQVVELLLSKDPDINIQSNDGWTALMLASSNGHHQVVELLLSKDPDINIQNNNGWTALKSACHNGHHQVVELLLSNDPDINIQNNNGWTALMSACHNGHHQVVELLLSNDPDINIQNNNGVTALMFASGRGHHQVVELLLSKDPDINIQNNNGVTALMFASDRGHHQVVELLLSKDPDINIQDNDGKTALIAACLYGHHQVVELLLSKDPDINIQNNNGVTALMFASDRGHHQVVELLLSKDPDINIQDNDGKTALIAACLYGHHQVVELLLSKDPDINIQTKGGVSALTITLMMSTFFIASCKDDEDFNIDALNQPQVNHLKVLQHLLDSHPNHIHTFDDMKLHSLAVAAIVNNFDAVEILMERCPITAENIVSAFIEACYIGQRSSMMIHLSKKLTTLSTDKRKLLIAAAEGDIGTLVSMLFEVGMSPDTPLVGGITPLMIAASCGHIDIVETLIQAGADVSKTNDEGKTALEIAEGIDYLDNIKKLLVSKTPTHKLDPRPSVRKKQKKTSLQSIFEHVTVIVKKAYNPAQMKHEASFETNSTLINIMS